MARPARRRNRSEGLVPNLFGVLVFALLLVLVNVWPGWEVLPFLTDDAHATVAVLNLVLIIGVVSQAACLVEDSPRLRALGSYVIGLATMVLLGRLWQDFPFALDDLDPAWASSIRLVLAALFAWATWATIRAAVRLVRGRGAPRLSAMHA